MVVNALPLSSPVRLAQRAPRIAQHRAGAPLIHGADRLLGAMCDMGYSLWQDINSEAGCGSLRISRISVTESSHGNQTFWY